MSVHAGCKETVHGSGRVEQRGRQHARACGRGERMGKALRMAQRGARGSVRSLGCSAQGETPKETGAPGGQAVAQKLRNGHADESALEGGPAALSRGRGRRRRCWGRHGAVDIQQELQLRWRVHAGRWPRLHGRALAQPRDLGVQPHDERRLRRSKAAHGELPVRQVALQQLRAKRSVVLQTDVRAQRGDGGGDAELCRRV